VRAPDLTYTDRININLGGKRVEVISRPIPHADDNTIVRFVDGTNVVRIRTGSPFTACLSGRFAPTRST
jgi:hypothetical protein